MGVLYIVATPIGNLEDITLRALRILGEVVLIACEDTRTTRKLLTRYGIATPVTSYHEHNKRAKTPRVLETLERGDVALVSEAGTPAVSDPGRDLVQAAVDGGVTVVPVPGPSALTACLAASGLPGDGFLFLGFLPRRRADRLRRLESVKAQECTVVAFETPHRLRESLTDLLNVMGDRGMVLCRELTKIHEELYRGTVSEALSHFVEPRGEFTLVMAGAERATRPADTAGALDQLRGLRSGGAKAREAVSTVASAKGLSRKEVYGLWLRTKADGGDSGSP